ncbi:L-mandelate dehydrogenase [Pseudohyphozyma bogoriensis]|nr:L-mandelate dehydrogenase [Pseudohyphozyma bogoriensis]
MFSSTIRRRLLASQARQLSSSAARTVAASRSGAVAFGAAATVGTLGLYLYNANSKHLLLEASDPNPIHTLTVDTREGVPEEISMMEVTRHKSKDSCWVVLDGAVWDVTEFLEAHPGGQSVILKHAGSDVTWAIFLHSPIHPPGTLENNLEAGVKKLGIVDPTTANRALLPPVEQVRGIKQIEALAQTVLANRAQIYYRGGSDDEQSLRDSFASFQRCRFRPRVLVDVKEVDPRTTILGSPSTLPIYVAPAAHARLGHELGEINITRGAAKTGIVQGISANSSVSLDDICQEKKDLVGQGQPDVGLAYQIYINRDRPKTEALMKKAIDGGCKGFFLTVDSPTLGNREDDFRVQELAGSMDDKPHNHPNTDVFGYYDTSVNWKDFAWIKKHAQGLPVWIKGVVTAEDVALAREHGAAGVILSNHGGRQLDYSRSPLDSLMEINARDPTLARDLEIYLDGGVRRGTDVVKALCLGAKGVGLGRPFLYAQTAFGEQGVIRAVRILEDEIVTTMRFVGARTLKDLKPEMVECLVDQYRIPPGPAPAK